MEMEREQRWRNGSNSTIIRLWFLTMFRRVLCMAFVDNYEFQIVVLCFFIFQYPYSRLVFIGNRENMSGWMQRNITGENLFAFRCWLRRLGPNSSVSEQGGMHSIWNHLNPSAVEY